MTNYPWPMDKPVEDFLAFADELSVSYYDEPNNDYALQIRYLIDRLKIAEAERDTLLLRLAENEVRV